LGFKFLSWFQNERFADIACLNTQHIWILGGKKEERKGKKKQRKRN